jgi:ABC-type uncharacterized transport system auxiliary subunit
LDICHFRLPLRPNFKPNKKKPEKMKKVFAILALTAVFAACNNSGEKKEETKDTTAAPATETVTPAPADTTAAPAADTTAAPAADTTKKAQ